ncbi:MAG: hypothetical protein ACU88J_04185 [Gammaproteobacteria bacterium]
MAKGEVFQHPLNDSYKACILGQAPSTLIRIFTHAHLGLERGLLDKRLPDLVVIDESFWQVLISIEPISRDDIVQVITSKSLLQAILTAFDSKTPLLTHLRKRFKTHVAEVIESAIEQISLTYPDINPSMDDEEIQSRLFSGYKRGKIVQNMLTQLLVEIQKFPKRKHSLTLRQDDKGFIFASRKSLTRFSKPDSKQIDVPIVCIDADLDKSINKWFLPEIRTLTISVKRNAHVIQCYSTSNAKTRFVPRQKARSSSNEARAADGHIESIELIINKLAQKHDDVLVVTYKPIIGKLKLPKNCRIIHFGGLRGLDQFKDCSAVIIVGRNQPSVSAVENMAAALYWDDDDDLVLTGERDYEVRGYRLTDGSHSGVNVTVCADPKTQRLMEQIRERETLQAIDRIRLIHNEEPKHVYIVSNLPLDIDVDQLHSSKQLRTGGSHMEQILADWSDEILPLSPKFLHETFPEHFKTLSAAKQAAAELLKLRKPSKTFNGNTYKSPTLARSFNIWEYRFKGFRGHNLKAITPLGIHPLEVQVILEKLHGQDILIKTPDDRLLPDYKARRKRRGLRDLTPRVHQHQEHEFEYYEHLEYHPNIPGGWYVNEPQLT